ncbi:MAG: PQQ-dependent sugar dehydrogenase [Gemmatimonadaceae bacterium]|nr:PQQ-dependent sugar dehydrogenase [Gemmatimonadaceae bacterium]
MLVAVLWMASLGVTFLAGAVAYKYRVRIRAMLSSVQGGEMIATNLYNIRVAKLRMPEGFAGGRDGGLAPLRDGVLLADREGALWFVGADRVPQALALRVPVNSEALRTDPDIEGLINAAQFGVKDVMIQALPNGLRLFVSHNQWNPDENCYVLRVSALETTESALTGGAAGEGSWRTLFDSSPCYELSTLPGGVSPHPTLGAGGRMALLDDQHLVLTIGGFKGELELETAEKYWDRSNSYGKTVVVDLGSGESRILTIGHRNPQGLTRDNAGRLWLTEHAARGGDELNLLTDGANYGYPAVSYGTAYGEMSWPGNPRQGHHEGYAKPHFAWVPSLGISQLIQVNGPAFAHWRDDLLVSSLAAQSLFRVRLEGDRVTFVEPVPIGHRVRDLVEQADGTLVAKTDDDVLVYLFPQEALSMDDPSLTPVERGGLLASSCSGCHALSDGAPDGIGPNLHGVIGRNLAARRGFAYSAALRAAGGSWSAERLRAYIVDPSAAVPGTTMPSIRSFTERELDDLLAYFGSLR